jgi:LuxR family maltose regulon positive regulatory protein
MGDDVFTPDVSLAKIRPPSLRPGVIARPALVNRLRRGGARIATVAAPAGWGKTTLLVQWAAAESRPVAWVSVDAHDEPLTLLKYFVAAIARVTAVEERLLASLSGPRPPALPALLSRAAKAVGAVPEPFLLVIDNADLIRATEARRVFLMLMTAAPAGSTIALGARTTPKVVPRDLLRQAGSVQEVRIEDLALADKDAEQVLRTENPALPAGEAAELIKRCEGWPAALFLASLLIGSSALGAPNELLAGSDRYLADYMRSEYLTQLRPRELDFVQRTSILEELNAPLCDAVLRTDDSASLLRTLARLQFVVPTGSAPDHYRYHGLFRELLARELAETAPGALTTLHRRAADWYVAHRRPASALTHAEAAGDPVRVAALLDTIALSASSCGHLQAVERAAALFDRRHHLDDYPAVAVAGSWVHAYRGRTAEANRWLAAAERGARRRGRPAAAVRPKISVVRAALCRRGPRQMLADATAALAKLSRRSPWYPQALHMHGYAVLLLGALDEADTLLTKAVTAAAQTAPETHMIALSQLSFLTRQRGDTDRADELADEASTIAVKLEGHPTTAIALAATAQSMLRHGRWAEARDLVTAAQPLTNFLTEALPWLGVGTRIELGRSYVTLHDRDAARVVVGEIDRLLDARPRLGVLVDQTRTLRNELEALETPVSAAAGLTPAELRLVPLLATHLSFREIADELQVSRNTVKTQAISIYRKLGVSGRSEAIATAEKLTIAMSRGA